MAGREVPYAQGFVITDGGTEREMGMGGQAPHFSLHVTLQTHAIASLIYLIKRILKKNVLNMNIVYFLFLCQCNSITTVQVMNLYRRVVKSKMKAKFKNGCDETSDY